MYIGYVDESGFVGRARNPDQPLQAIACILPNAYNLHRTTDEFVEIITIFRKNNIPITELKAKEMYRGRGAWSKVPGEIRHRVFELYLKWLGDRRHKIILSLIDNNRFFDLKDGGSTIANHLGFPYVAGALQVALAIQKHHKGEKRNKGKTILIFDEQEGFENYVAELIAKPPEFTDDFYGYQPRDGIRLNQIIDTAYFVKSHHAHMVQVADAVAFVSRLHLELTVYGELEAYDGERESISSWFEMIRRRLITRGCVYPIDSHEICKFYRDVAPLNMPF